jgi:hypothetical protein
VESFGQVGVLGQCLFERKRGGKQRKNIFFLPCFARPGEEEDPQCRSKRHHFGLLFL